MLRWTSAPIAESALPDGLDWRDEKPHEDYRVNLAFCLDVRGRGYRRLTFPDGSRMFSELTY